ncbi:MAG: histidine kinase [Gammaproteobacteria bacterium]|nr:histidine kinase [Gammaproteobacteria bacterium]
MTRQTGASRFRHSIRFQLLLLSLVLLLIPWGGYRYLQEMERFLRQAQSQRLQQAAEAAAVAARYQEDLFTLAPAQSGATIADSGILLHRLAAPVQLDGYDEEWLPYKPDRRHFSANGDLAFDLLAGVHGDYLYLLFDVSDDHRLAWRPQANPDLEGDSVEIALEHPDGNFNRYRIAPASPGWTAAYRRQDDGWQMEPRIRGELQLHSKGYRLEMRIPRYLVSGRIGVGVIDVDDAATRAVVARLRTAPLERKQTLGRLIDESSELEAAIAPLVQSGMRIWIVDRAGRVLASHGRLRQTDTSGQQPQEELFQSLLKWLIRLSLGHPANALEDDLAGRRRIDTAELARIWRGERAASGWQTSGRNAIVESVARPVITADGTVGAALVEQSSNEILTLQSQAAMQLLHYSILLIALIALLLLGFSTLLVIRIHRLRDRLDSAVSSEGRILGALPSSHARDEIGDLQRSFSGVMQRLQEYNAYLEAMASRLAHELKTPLVIARSSLDNLQLLAPDSAQQTYIERAQQGLRRLAMIIDRIREASRIEQLIAHAQKRPSDLQPVLIQLIDGYRSAHPEQRFEYSGGEASLRVAADIDLICQALEKLLANALDFHAAGSTIRLESSLRQDSVTIRVINRGAPLCDGLLPRLFQAMVSERTHQGDEPHLGLGLYLVRLIVEFHGGNVAAFNLADGSGVVFEIRLSALDADAAR